MKNYSYRFKTFGSKYKVSVFFVIAQILNFIFIIYYKHDKNIEKIVDKIL